MFGERVKKEILIIDDTPDVIKVLVNLLNHEYKVYFAKEGKKGIEIARERKPDLILLDIIMPGIDGYEVCRILKIDQVTKDIPVVFITAVSEAMDEAKAFKVGGVDYITKPFVPIVVTARVSNQMRLAESMSELRRLYALALDANPITGLPGNNTIKKEIEEHIHKKSSVSIIYLDLDNFKAFNDVYGFAHGDEVILFTASLFKKAAEIIGIEDSIFIGHIGGDDFVAVIPSESDEAFMKEYIRIFDIEVRNFYSEDDKFKGFITTENRRGQKVDYPIMSVSIAAVNLGKTCFSSYLIVNDLCTEIKHLAKEIEGSNYQINKRTLVTSK